VDAYNTLWFISHYLIIVNAATDPIIYGLTNENFRRAFRATALSQQLFGATAAVSSQRTSRPPQQRLEPRNLSLESGSGKQWFILPKQTDKTRNTDCYI
jgi:hypothetical protein